jgi:stage II sporulation protein D
MDIAPRFWVRVLLLDDIELCSFKSASPFTVSSQRSAVGGVRFDAFDMPIEIKVSQGTITLNGRGLLGRQVLICPDAPYIFTLDGRDYRGKLKLVVNPDGGSLDAINLVPIEPYLAGVVGAEMPNYWEPQALKAQAISARTYCLYIKNRFGAGRDWDVKKTESNQVYLGLAGESAPVWSAVNSTLGQVLACTRDFGNPALFPTYYSSTCGGHTEDSRNVFGGDHFEPLAGVVCPYCRNVAKPRFLFWQAKFDKTDVTEKLLQKYPKLKKLGQIKNIVAEKKSDYRIAGSQQRTISRLTMVKLIGSAGKSDFLRAEDLRLTIDPTGRKLKSTICKIIDMGNKWMFSSGKGWGHGVGMCQCGAEGMARRNNSAEQILSYYYPGSKILTLDY